MTDARPSGASMADAATMIAGTIASGFVDHQRLDQMRGVDEAFGPHMVDQRQHRIPETLDIGEDDRLAVMAELRPGHDLDDLLDRADAARQRHKGVGFLEHRVFALVHVVGDDEFVEPVKRGFGGFLVDEEARNDAGDLAAGPERASATAPMMPLVPPP